MLYSIECNYKCQKNGDCYQIDNTQETLICNKCANYFYINENEQFCLQCEEGQYYIDSVEDGQTMKECIPTCNFKTHYPDDKIRSCRMMKRCPNLRELGMDIEDSFSLDKVQVSKKQSLILCHYESKSNIQLWDLQNGEYIGIINSQLYESVSKNDSYDLIDVLLGDSIEFNSSINCQNCIIVIFKNQIQIWNSKKGVIIDQYKFPSQQQIICYYFVNKEQYVFTSQLDYTQQDFSKIFYFDYYQNKQYYLGKQNLQSVNTVSYNQFSHEFIYSGYDDNYNFYLQVFFLNEQMSNENGVKTNLIQLNSNNSNFSRIFSVGPNLYLYWGGNKLVLFNSKNSSFKTLSIPTNTILAPCSKNTQRIDYMTNIFDDKLNFVQHLIFMIFQCDNQQSIQINGFQSSNEQFERIVELAPLKQLDKVQLIANIVENNCIRLLVQFLYEYQVEIYEINYLDKIIVKKYSISVKLPALKNSRFLIGFWDQQELIFVKSQTLILTEIEGINEQQELQIKFQISNFNNNQKLTELDKDKYLLQIYEDVKNNQILLLYDTINKIIIIDLNSKEIIDQIYPLEQSINDDNYIIKNFSIVQKGYKEYIIVIYKNYKICIYDYDTLLMTEQDQFLEFNENNIQNFQFIKFFESTDLIIIQSLNTIIKLDLSNEGKIIQKNVLSLDSEITEIVYFPQAIDNQIPSSLYVISKNKSQILQIYLDTLDIREKDYRLQGQSLFSYKFDFQNQQIGISSDGGLVTILDHELNLIFEGTIDSDKYKCHFPIKISETDVFCIMQKVENSPVIQKPENSTEKGKYCHSTVKNIGYYCFGVYFDHNLLNYDIKSQSLLYFTNLDNLNMIGMQKIYESNIYYYSNTYILNQQINSTYYKEGSNRIFLSQDGKNDLLSINVDLNFEQVVEYQKEQIISSVQVLNEENKIIYILESSIYIYDINTSNTYNIIQSENKVCNKINSSSLQYYAEEQFYLFICDKKLFQINLTKTYQNKLIILSTFFDQDNKGINSFCYIAAENKLAIQKNLSQLQLFDFRPDDFENNIIKSKAIVTANINTSSVGNFVYFKTKYQLYFIYNDVKKLPITIKVYFISLVMLDKSFIFLKTISCPISKLQQPSVVKLEYQNINILIIIGQLYINFFNVDTLKFSDEKDATITVRFLSIPNYKSYMIVAQYILFQKNDQIGLYSFYNQDQKSNQIKEFIVTEIIVLKDQKFLSEYLIVPDKQNLESIQIIAAIQVNLECQIYIYNYKGKVIKAIPLTVEFIFATSFSYDDKSGVLFICTNMGLIFGIETRISYYLAYVFNTQYSIEYYSKIKDDNTQFLYNIYGNTLTFWNSHYIGLISISNIFEKPIKIEQISKKSMYYLKNKENLFLFDQNNILWNLNHEKLTYQYTFNNLDSKADIIYVDSVNFEDLIIFQLGKIYIIQKQRVKHIYDVNSENYKKNILLLQEDEQENILFKAYIIFTKDKKVLAITQSFELQEVFIFEKEKSQFACQTVDFIISSDSCSDIIIISKETFDFKTIDLRISKKLISINCDEQQNGFYTIDQNYQFKAYKINEDQIESIERQINHTIPYVQQDVRIQYSSQTSIIFIMHPHKKLIFTYDFNLEKNQIIQKVQNGIIPPCANFELKIETFYIFTKCDFQVNIHSKSDMSFLQSLYTLKVKEEIFQDIIVLQLQSQYTLKAKAELYQDIIEKQYLLLLYTNKSIQIHKILDTNQKYNGIELFKQIETYNQQLLFYYLKDESESIVIISLDENKVYIRFFSTYDPQQDTCYENIYSENQYSQYLSTKSLENTLKGLSPNTIYINCFFSTNFFFTALNLSDVNINVRVYQQEIVFQDIQNEILFGFDPEELLQKSENFTKLNPVDIRNIKNIDTLYLLKISLSLKNKIIQYSQYQSEYLNNELFAYDITRSQNTKTIQFNRDFKNITLDRIIVKDQSIVDTIYEMIDLKHISFSRVVFKNIKLINSILINITNVEQVTLKNIVLQDCIFINSKLFSLNDIQSIIISNVTVINNDVGYSSTIFDMASSKNIQLSYLNFINNTNINLNCNDDCLNNYHPPTLLVFEKIEYSQINQVKFNANQNIQLIYSINWYKAENFQISLQDETFKLTQINITENKLQDQNQNLYNRYSLITIQSSNLYITDVFFTRNNSPDRQGTIIISNSVKVNFKNVYFRDNTSLEGGSIYLIKSKILFDKCTFINNTAKASGGAIYLKNSTIQSNNTIFQNNSALIGGAIRLSPDSKIFRSNETFLNNKASIFGNNEARFSDLQMQLEPNFESYQTESISTDYEFSQQKGQTYLLNNVRPGSIFSFKVMFKDKENNILTFDQPINQYPKIIQEDFQKITISINLPSDQYLVVNTNLMINLFSSPQVGKGFFLKNMQFNAQQFMSQQQKQSIKKSVNFIIQAQDLAKEIDSYFSNIQFIIDFRNCISGEIVQQDKLKVQCNPCETGTYSLENPFTYDDSSSSFKINNLKCIECPSIALSCEKNQISIKNGYWRFNNRPDLILKCTQNPDNCQAQTFNQQKYCIKGYTGPLCESCENKQEKDSSWFVKVDKICIECTEEQRLFFKIEFGIMFSIFLIYAFFQTINLNEKFKKVQIGYYLRKMQMLSIFKSCDVNGNFQKTVSIINQVDMFFPNLILLADKIFGRQYISIMEKTQCFYLRYIKHTQIDENGISQMKYPFSLHYFRTILILTIPFSYLLVIFLFYYILIFLKIIQKKRDFFYNIFQLIILIFQPIITVHLLSSLSCRKVGGQEFMNTDLQYECYTEEHKQYIFYLLLPSSILWTTIPFLYFFLIRRQKLNLDQFKYLFRYGILYSEFKQNMYYWEFVRFGMRMLIMLSISVGQTYTYTMFHISLFALIGYLIYIFKKSPYKDQKICKLDIQTHTIIILIMFFNLQSYQISDLKNETREIIVSYMIRVLITIIYVCYVIIILFQIIFDHIKGPLLKKCLPTLRTLHIKYWIIRIFINIESFNTQQDKMPTFRRWMLLRKEIGKLCANSSKRFLLNETLKRQQSYSLLKTAQNISILQMNKFSSEKLNFQNTLMIPKQSTEQIFNVQSPNNSQDWYAQSPYQKAFNEEIQQEQDEQTSVNNLSRFSVLFRKIKTPKIIELNQISLKNMVSTPTNINCSSDLTSPI